MKIRHDFVSNSSSSSFIIDHKSNVCRAFLDDKEMKSLSLEDYIKQFAWREIEPDSYDYYYAKRSQEPEKMEFVSPQAFAKLFTASMHCVLPTTAKAEYEAMEAIAKKRDEYYQELKKNSNPSFLENQHISDMLKEEDHLKDMILDKVIKALTPKYGKMKFDYAEIEDSYVDSDDELDDFNSTEDMYLQRHRILAQHLPVEFWRVFSNH